MKDQAVLNALISNEILPKEGPFEITHELVDQFYETYGTIYNRTKRNRTNDIRYAKRLAALSLLKLLKCRSLDTYKRPNLKSTAGFLYVIANPVFPDHVKIGLTKNIKKRLSSYQTCDPHRQFRIEHFAFFENVNKIETEILATNNAEGEWILKSNLNAVLTKYFGLYN